MPKSGKTGDFIVLLLLFAHVERSSVSQYFLKASVNFPDKVESNIRPLTMFKTLKCTKHSFKVSTNSSPAIKKEDGLHAYFLTLRRGATLFCIVLSSHIELFGSQDQSSISDCTH